MKLVAKVVGAKSPLLVRPNLPAPPVPTAPVPKAAGADPVGVGMRGRPEEGIEIVGSPVPATALRLPNVEVASVGIEKGIEIEPEGNLLRIPVP